MHCGILGDVRDSQNEYYDLQKSILKSLDNLLKEIGYEEHYNDDDMTKSLRLLAAKWACRLGLEQCKKAALSKLIDHIIKPDMRYV